MRLFQYLSRFFLASLFLIIYLLGKLVSLFRRVQGSPISDHSDGKRFFNPHSPDRNIFQFLSWFIRRAPKPWPTGVRTKNGHTQTLFFPSDKVLVTFINHSTFLIQWNHTAILTDPIWSSRASPYLWMGPKRSSSPGVRMEDLPRIDLILISHDHYDHLDLPSLKILHQKDHPTIVTGLRNKKFLNDHGINKVHEMDWWEEFSSNLFKIIFLPAQHASGRGIWSQNKSLWGGFSVSNSSGTIYFSGDTGYGPHFKEIHSKLGPPSLSFLPIGAFKPEWFMKSVHMGPKEAIQAHLDLNSKRSIAMHYDTFQLGDEEWEEAPKLLLEELEKSKISSNTFSLMKIGSSLEIPLY